MGKGRPGPGGIGGEGGDLAPGLDRAEQRQHRDQYRNDQRRGPQPGIPRPDLEPIMQAEHRVGPGHHQGHQLQHPAGWRVNEIDPQEKGVIEVVGAEVIVGDPGGGDVMGKQYRYRETERELGQFAGIEAQGAPLPQRPQRQQVMHQKTAVEQTP